MAGLVFNYLSARTITRKLLNFIIMAEVHYMTQDGLDKLKKDLADALAQRPVISAAIAEAREKGDLSENAEYDAVTLRPFSKSRLLTLRILWPMPRCLTSLQSELTEFRCSTR